MPEELDNVPPFLWAGGVILMLALAAVVCGGL